MLFNSIDFAIFLPIVFILYWLAQNKTIQNCLLVIASYIFYGLWDWRFLILIAFSSLVDYCVGIGLSKTDNQPRRKLLLSISIIVNLGCLGFFKYYNFFIDNFVELFQFFGHSINVQGLDIILPIGISFYTFQTLSYSIDIYQEKLKPVKNIIVFFAFVSFFPQLVAGPIERATHLVPQFCQPRVFNYNDARDGLRQMLWGLFKKIVIADNCAVYANRIFDNYAQYSGSTLLLGAFFFAFQIYGDFSGYSDIAIGTSRLFGFNLMRNFAYPYFSRDIAEFWRRWHISLSTWFRDYIYIPLGGSRGGIWMKIRNVLIIFIITGFWHGANCTFIIWGAINGLCFLPLMLMNQNRRNLEIVAQGRLLPSLQEIVQMGSTFFIILIAWVFFRAETVADSIHYLSNMFSVSLFSLPEIRPKSTIRLILFMIVIEWLQRDKQHGLQLDNTWIPKLGRWFMYYGIIAMTLLFAGKQQEFIYFQF